MTSTGAWVCRVCCVCFVCSICSVCSGEVQIGLTACVAPGGERSDRSAVVDIMQAPPPSFSLLFTLPPSSFFLLRDFSL